jgi:integrase/recombinase XerD
MLNQFVKYLKEDNKSDNTINGYLLDIKGYFNWLNTNIQLLTKEDIFNFKKYLQEEKKDSAKTINRKLCSLKKYNEFLLFNNHQASLVITSKDMIKIQTEYASPTHTNEKQINNLLIKLKKDNTKESIRNYTIAYLIEYTGIRISEVLNIKLDDIDFDNEEITIRKGKGNKQRIIYISKVKNELKYWLQIRSQYKNSNDSEYLFISQKGEKLRRESINKIFNEGSKKITPHSLRHYFCSNALEKGMNIHEVANQAGHSNIQTTMIYLNPNKEQLKKKMATL